ncbi:efflux RND transporter periplasmic adaptor subunit [Novosphingopyxis sp.]|uniref:efflux RND transporter periplasmic adaptor subunit n=1 Tax=Novosphingopyxis sp. TaxID=2709690 RepID=UPI003B5C2E4D
MVSTAYMRTIFPAAMLALAGCSGGDEEPAAPPAMPVDVMTVQSQSVPNIVELPGRIEPVRTAEVRARVTGIVQARLYEEGTDIAKGAPLFRIDPRELQATGAQVRANLQRLRATAANANAVVRRYKPLVSEQAISQQEYDAAIAAQREAEAAVSEAKAQLDAAQLQLGYTTVRAPISGRVGRAQVTEGALVSQTEATLMTRIEQLDPVYVTLSQSSSEVLKIRRAIAAGDIALSDDGRIEFEVTFEDGTRYPITGHLNFFDYSVDQGTSSVTLRGEITNPQRLLLPGDFVRARIMAGTREGGIMVPQRAVQIGENGASLFVVGAKGVAQSRKVTLGPLSGTDWIVEDGLRPGDKVIVSNLQKIREGAPVKPRDARSVLGSGTAPAKSKAAAPSSKAK